MQELETQKGVGGKEESRSGLRMQHLFDASSQADYAAAGALGTGLGSENAQTTARDAQRDRSGGSIKCASDGESCTRYGIGSGE